MEDACLPQTRHRQSMRTSPPSQSAPHCAPHYVSTTSHLQTISTSPGTLTKSRPIPSEHHPAHASPSNPIPHSHHRQAPHERVEIRKPRLNHQRLLPDIYRISPACRRHSGIYPRRFRACNLAAVYFLFKPLRELCFLRFALLRWSLATLRRV